MIPLLSSALVKLRGGFALTPQEAAAVVTVVENHQWESGEGVVS